MLPRSLRIARERFNGVFRSAKVYRGKCLVLYAKPSPKLGFAVVIAKKVVRRAVDRHRAKRVVLAAVKEIIPFPHLAQPHTFVFRLVRNPENDADLRAEAVHLMKKSLQSCGES